MRNHFLIPFRDFIKCVYILFFFVSTSFESNAQKFACDDRIYFFRNDSTHLSPNGFLSFIENYQNGLPKVTDMCPMRTYFHNSLGANPVDSFMYYTDGSMVHRLENNCKNTPVCELPFVSFCGSFDWQGWYWVADYSQNLLYAYDLVTCKQVKGPYALPETVADITYNLFDCHLYMAGGAGTIYKMSPEGQIVDTYQYAVATANGTPGGLTFGTDQQLYAMEGYSSGGVKGGNFYRISKNKFQAQIVRNFNNNNGPTLNNRTDLASFPCIQASIKAYIESDNQKGCLPFRVQLTGKSFSVPQPNYWKWYFEDGTTDSVQHPVHTFFDPGIHKIKLIAGLVSDCGKSYYDTTHFEVEAENKPTVLLFSPVQQLCEGEKLVLRAFGTGPFEWSTGEVGEVIQVAPAFSAMYWVKSTSATQLCAVMDSVILSVKHKPIVSVPKGAVCEGADQVHFEASGAAQYTWSDGFRGPKRSLPVSTGNNWKVIGTDDGCSDTAEAVIRIFPAPKVDILANKADICLGDSLQLVVSGNTKMYTSLANGQVSFEKNILIYPMTTDYGGIYTVLGYDSLGCTSQKSISVHVDKPPQLDLPVRIAGICPGKPGALHVSTFPLSEILWKGPNGFASSEQTISFPVTHPEHAGRYQVLATANGCTASDTVELVVYPPPDSSITSDKAFYCAGDAVFLTAAANTSYRWSGPNGVFSAEQNVMLTDAVHNEIYQLTVSSAFGCTATSSVQLLVKDRPAITLAVKDIRLCEGTISLDAQFSPANAVFNWTGPNNFSSDQFSTEISPATNSHSGSYIATAVADGCQISDTVQVIIDQKPDAAIYPVAQKTVICEEGQGQIKLDLLAKTGNESVSWYKEDIMESFSQEVPLPLQKPEQTGTYYAIVQSEHSLCPPVKSNLIQAKIYEMPKAGFTTDVIKLKYHDHLQVPIPLKEVHATYDEVHFVSWSPVTWLDNANILYPTIHPEPEQKIIDYILTLKTGPAGEGCESQYKFTYFNLYPISVPNVFSPNNDNLNDFWIIKGLGWFPETHVYIYNRWGSEVYSNEEGYKEPWNGMYNGKDLAVGTYYYVIELKGSQDHTDYSFCGDVTIIR